MSDPVPGPPADHDEEPDFDAVLSKAIALITKRKRISLAALKYALNVDAVLLAAVKDEIVDSQKLAVIENGNVLVWVGGAVVFDLAFNEAHPPLMRDRDHYPPERCDPGAVGVFKIEKKSFERVHDPKYPCQIGATEVVSPHEFAEREALRAKKEAEVERYELRRERLWEQVSRKHYSMAVNEQRTVTFGLHTRDMTIQTESWSQRFGTHLNLNITVPLLPEEDPEGGPSAGGDTGFSAEMSHELSITHETEATYTHDTTTTTSVTRNPGDYIVWQLLDRMSLWRVAKGGQPEPVVGVGGDPIELVVRTATLYEDYLPPPGNAPAGDPGAVPGPGAGGGGGHQEPPPGDPPRG